ncbi:MAG: hypothetical protein CFE34_14670 [Rhodobacteraceae bacterium PARR1]|nr:MAG: hypothetical protein CFE34_14670 [Rhodobacteraceae bacterium PARR1]
MAAPPEVALWQGVRALLRHDPLSAPSCKVSARGVADRRVLLTFPRAALLAPDDPAPLAALVEGTLPAVMADHWHRADVVHLGLDGDEAGGAVRKLYLEFPPDAEPEPNLAYLALKCGGGRQALHRYDRVAEARALLTALDLPPALAEAATWLADLSGNLLRVAEPGSARLSLDIGLADVSTGAVLPVVTRMVAAINPDAPAPLVVPSHVALGRDRHGGAFLTLYGWPVDA